MPLRRLAIVSAQTTDGRLNNAHIVYFLLQFDWFEILSFDNPHSIALWVFNQFLKFDLFVAALSQLPQYKQQLFILNKLTVLVSVLRNICAACDLYTN